MSNDTIYHPAFGAATFAQIFDRTCNLAAYIMRNEFWLDCDDDIDDALQFGYWKLWEKLEKDPTFIEGKSDSYIARSVCFRAKRERQRHIRHNMRNEALPEHIHAPGYAPHGGQIRAVERAIDLEWAMAAAADYFGDDQRRIYALYYATTDVTIKDMESLGLSRHTLRDHTNEVKRALRTLLRGYKLNYERNQHALLRDL